MTLSPTARSADVAARVAADQLGALVAERAPDPLTPEIDWAGPVGHPLPDENGDISVPRWRFPGGEKVEKALVRRERQAVQIEKVIERLPAGERTTRWLEKISKGKFALTQLRGFTELYRAYVQTEIVFDDSNTRALLASLPYSTPSPTRCCWSTPTAPSSTPTPSPWRRSRPPARPWWGADCWTCCRSSTPS